MRPAADLSGEGTGAVIRAADFDHQRVVFIWRKAYATSRLRQTRRTVQRVLRLGTLPEKDREEKLRQLLRRIKEEEQQA
jgi:hypothetical protein